MNGGYNLYNTEALFRKYLLAENKTSITVKNYGSDLRHFIGWVTLGKRLHTSAPEEMSELITQELIEDYVQYLEDSKTPIKTINRRLSTLRRFCSFSISQGWMSHNPAKKMQNRVLQTSSPHKAQFPNPIAKILQEMKTELRESEGAYQSAQTVKDVEEFIAVTSSKN